MEDEHLLAPSFPDQASWERWKVALAAMFGLPPPRCVEIDPVEFYREHTGRSQWPTQQASEAWLPIGVRGGKALALDTPIPTPSGWTTMGELRAGDELYGRDGKPTRVRYALPVQHGRPCFEVEFSNGEVIVADAEHDWVVEDYRSRKNLNRRREPARGGPQSLKRIALPRLAKDLSGVRFGKLVAVAPVGVRAHVQWEAQCDCGGTVVVPSNRLQMKARSCGCDRRDASIGERTVTTRELGKALMARDGHQTNFAVRLPKPLRAPKAKLPIDPYVLGVWLGDGHSKAACVTSADPEIIAEIERRGFKASKWSAHLAYGILGLHARLRLADLLGNKHIPQAYLRASEQQRLDLLRGLMDTDGYCSADGKCCFYSTSRLLADQVYELICSLGWRCGFSEGTAKLNGRVIGPKFTIHFAPTQPVFLLPRKAERQALGTTRAARRSGSRDFLYVVDVRPCASVPVRCIQVENHEGVFLAGRSMVPTHNSRVAALIAVYLAIFRDYSPYLAAGEYGTVMVMAADRKQARTVFGYIRAMIGDNEYLADLVEQETQESITLRNRIRIEVHTASFKSIRGYTCVSCVADEIAIWNADGANPDSEIITAIRSRFATIPNAMLVAISSPYARVGELWETYDRHFGDKGSPDIFVWQASTRDMNPSVPQSFVDRQYEKDPAKASAEFGGEFRTDVERFVPIEVVKACIPVEGRQQNPPAEGLQYRAFVDPSGGRTDPMTMAIGHRASTGIVVLDALMGVKPPFEPTEAIRQMVALCRPYRVTKVHGDRFGGEWPREGFRNQGIEYALHPRSKSELYVEMLPHLTSRTIELLDHPKLALELTGLERRVSPSGRELIDHPKGGHDDYANAVAGLIDLLSKGGGMRPVW